MVQMKYLKILTLVSARKNDLNWCVYHHWTRKQLSHLHRKEDLSESLIGSLFHGYAHRQHPINLLML
jgi:hypothetical protein